MTWSLPEPQTLDEMAERVHEWYLSLIRAGFTEDQALFLVANGVGGTK